MKETPTTFSGDMVKAILEGKKSQTRRVIKPQPPPDAETCGPNSYSGEGGPAWWWSKQTDSNPVVWPKPGGEVITCPYGKPGDLLWVKETWASVEDEYGTPLIAYRAGGYQIHALEHDKPRHSAKDFCFAATAGPYTVDAWRPSRYMPKWASRIWLEVTDVRVERLNEISEEDAVAEGCEPMEITAEDLADLAISDVHPDVKKVGAAIGQGTFTAKFEYMMLWNSLNKKRGYGSDKNPWVWVISFKRIEKPMEHVVGWAVMGDRFNEGDSPCST